MSRLLLLVALLLPSFAWAQTVGAGVASSPWHGTVSLLFENDAFGKTDRWYSNGMQASWRSPAGALPAPLAWLDGTLGAALGPGESRWGFSLGQTIFTPRDTRRRDPDVLDRPYAGHLFAAIGLDRVSDRQFTSLELQIGVVGPSSLGRQVQDGVHDILGDRRPRGWRYQLRDEPVVDLIAERRWRLPLGELAGVESDAVPAVAVSLGNGNLHGSLGGMLRVGQGLAADFGPSRIRSAQSGGTVLRPTGREFGWYLFAGIEGRAVGRDITLDGNTWRDSRSVRGRPVVADAQFGAALLWRAWRLSYTHVLRSEEFYGQRGGVQQFGSINLAFRF